MQSRRQLLGTAALALAGMVGAAIPASAQNLPTIRWGYLLPPLAQLASVFDKKPELTKNLNKTYKFEAKFVRGSPLLVTALAANEVDIANLGFSSFNQAVLNAGLNDLRVIFDESEDGIDGYYSTEIRVLNDSGINRVEDLKGKVLATNAVGSAIDMLIRNRLRRAGLEMNRDYTMIETPFPATKQMLLEKKIDAGSFPQPFVSDPEVMSKTRAIFNSSDALGKMMANFVVGRGDFIKANRAAMVDFMEDYLRIVRWYYDPANRKETIAIVSEATKIPLGTLDTYFLTKRDNYRNMDGLPDIAAIQSNMKVQKDLGLTRAEINVEEHSDLSMIKEAAARLKK